jgi:hypothetical protein
MSQISLNSAVSIEESTMEELHQRALPVVCTGETGLLFCVYILRVDATRKITVFFWTFVTGKKTLH